SISPRYVPWSGTNLDRAMSPPSPDHGTHVSAVFAEGDAGGGRIRGAGQVGRRRPPRGVALEQRALTQVRATRLSSGMADVILHHYPVSPFAEKVRAILGYKGLAWRSVDIPVVMPKPDLTALTGGYRKTPVLQIGCDVYCDTTLIVRVLDALAPERLAYRPEQDAMAIPAGRWLDHHLFFSVIAHLFDPATAAASQDMLGGPEGAAAFARDRGPMLAAARVKPPRLSEARVILHDLLRGLDAQLAARGP